jgi:hypothetical protein
MATTDGATYAATNITVTVGAPEDSVTVYQNVGIPLPSTTVVKRAAGWGVQPHLPGSTVVPGAGSDEAQVYENVT